MRRIQLLFAICMSLLSAMVAGSQSTDTGALPAALRTHVQAERFGIVTAVRGLPLGVRDRMQTMFGGALDIADPDAEFANNAVNSKLPTRRLVAAGCAPDHHCLVYYERGGAEHTWHVILFHWSPDATRFEWGGTAPGGLRTIDDVLSAVLSGKVKGPAKIW